MSHRSRDRVVVMSEVVYFGVGINFRPRPRTTRVWCGTLLWSVRSWKARLGICSGGFWELVEVEMEIAFWKGDWVRLG